MWIRILLVFFIFSGLCWADDQADYDQIKAKIQEQKRELGRHHSRRHFAEAMATQKEIASLSKEALELALKSPHIGDAGAWNYHAGTLNDAGLHQQALEAVTRYLATPLLDRNGFRNGWRKRAQIYRRQANWDEALKCLDKALTFSDEARDKFYVYRDRAHIQLDQAEPESALRESEKMASVVESVEEKHRKAAQRDLQSTLVRVHRELGNAEQARTARRREMEFKKEILEFDLAHFDEKFPQP